jgi:hypothetical protein
LKDKRRKRIDKGKSKLNCYDKTKHKRGMSKGKRLVLGVNISVSR